LPGKKAERANLDQLYRREGEEKDVFMEGEKEVN